MSGRSGYRIGVILAVVVALVGGLVVVEYWERRLLRTVTQQPSVEDFWSSRLLGEKTSRIICRTTLTEECARRAASEVGGEIAWLEADCQPDSKCFIGVSDTKKSVSAVMATPWAIHRVISWPRGRDGPGSAWSGFTTEFVTVSDTEMTMIINADRSCEKRPILGAEIGCDLFLEWRKDSAVFLLIVSSKERRPYEALKEDALATASRVRYSSPVGDSRPHG